MLYYIYVTPVIGLGVGNHVFVYEEGVITFLDEFYGKKLAVHHKELHLAWSPDEEDIPPKLLKYLKQHYFVKTQYSNTIRDKCFANYCKCCGALQGNWFLFSEPDSVLSCCVPNEESLVKRMSNLKIKCIRLKDALQLNWVVNLCSNDYAYLKYGICEEIILLDRLDSKEVSYEELYVK